jgi:hypothetical protein
MKPLSYSLIAAALACGLASAQTTAYTTPVGYVTTTLKGGQFNLTSLTVHNPTVSAGVISAKDVTLPPSVTVTGANFLTLLGTPGANNTHILELADGSIQEITEWGADYLRTSANFNGQVTAGTTTYKLRKAATVSSVFGATNSAGLKSSPDGEVENASGIPTADTIQLWNGSGFTTIYYFDDTAGTTGWYTGTGDPAANIPIIHADGFFVRRAAGAPVNLVVTGEVKTTKTSGALDPGFSYLGAVAPVGLTLATSGLENYIGHSADGIAIDDNGKYVVDNVQIQTPEGGYRICYYFGDGPTGVWYDAEGNLAGDAVLDGGFLIYSISALQKPYTVSAPPSYSSL